MGADPAVAGTYKLTLTNIGQSETSVNVIFGHLPGVEENNRVDFGAFSGVLVGSGIIIAGIIAMIAGVVIVIVDKRRAPAAQG